MSIASALPEEVDETERLFEKEADYISRGSPYSPSIYTYVELETEKRNPFVPGPSVSSSSVMMIIPEPELSTRAGAGPLN